MCIQLLLNWKLESKPNKQDILKSQEKKKQFENSCSGHFYISLNTYLLKFSDSTLVFLKITEVFQRFCISPSLFSFFPTPKPNYSMYFILNLTKILFKSHMEKMSSKANISSGNFSSALEWYTNQIIRPV